MVDLWLGKWYQSKSRPHIPMWLLYPLGLSCTVWPQYTAYMLVEREEQQTVTEYWHLVDVLDILIRKYANWHFDHHCCDNPTTITTATVVVRYTSNPSPRDYRTFSKFPAVLSQFRGNTSIPSHVSISIVYYCIYISHPTGTSDVFAYVELIAVCDCIERCRCRQWHGSDCSKRWGLMVAHSGRIEQLNVRIVGHLLLLSLSQWWIQLIRWRHGSQSTTLQELWSHRLEENINTTRKTTNWKCMILNDNSPLGIPFSKSMNKIKYTNRTAEN